MSILDSVGGTPLVRLDGVLVKLECSNPSGSIKDRIAKYMLLQARRRGELRPGDTVVEATSGNTGIALALMARELGHPVIVYMPEFVTPERRAIVERFGGEVRLTPAAGGYQEAVDRRDAHRGQPGFFVPDQFGNPDNPACHEETTGAELLAQLAEMGVTRLDAFVAGVGTGGTLMGVATALKKEHPDLRVVAVEPSESAVMAGGEPGAHGIHGIGDGFIPPIVDMARVTDVETVTTDDAHAEAERIHEAHGYCVGMSSGANMLVALRLRERGLAVATVWPDCADRYGTMGLAGPAEEDHGACPLRSRCAERSQGRLPR